MARLTKDCSVRGQKATAEFVSKAPSKTFIIPGKELVQVVAKVLLHFLYSCFGNSAISNVVSTSDLIG